MRFAITRTLLPLSIVFSILDSARLLLGVNVQPASRQAATLQFHPTGARRRSCGQPRLVVSAQEENDDGQVRQESSEQG